MKTLIFTLLFTASLVFSINSKASANVGTTEKTSIDPTALSSIHLNNDVVEEILTIETWMADDNYWNVTSNDLFQNEQEESLEIENWMINHEKWDKKEITPNSFTIWEDEKGTIYVFKKRAVTEPALQIEKWMVDYRYWN